MNSDQDAGSHNVESPDRVKALGAKSDDERLYWAKAIALVGDDLASCTPDRFLEKRDKFVAVLRNAAYRTGGEAALDGQPVPVESIHDICHNLHGTVDARAFADACRDEQRKLYGCAPDADRVVELTAQRDACQRENSRLVEARRAMEARYDAVSARLVALSTTT